MALSCASGGSGGVGLSTLMDLLGGLVGGRDVRFSPCVLCPDCADWGQNGLARAQWLSCSGVYYRRGPGVLLVFFLSLLVEFPRVRCVGVGFGPRLPWTPVRDEITCRFPLTRVR